MMNSSRGRTSLCCWISGRSGAARAAFSPMIDQLAQELKGTAKVCKINIDEEPELASAFGVMSIPTLLVIQDGKIVAQSVGLKAKEQIKQMIPV